MSDGGNIVWRVMHPDGSRTVVGNHALGMFGDDGEGLRKAKGDIAHALKVAAKYNQNGPGCSALLAEIGGGRG